MKLSRYFDELSSAYAYEIEDLTYDSGGDDVLKKRLKDKRNQFGDLLMMCTTDPVMVAPAFHRALQFTSSEVLDRVVSSQPGEFPPWEEVAASIDMEPWAEAMVKRALQAPEGDQFLLIAAGLEYVLSKIGASAAAGHGEIVEEEAEEDEDEDLGEAGEDYLGEQGFDRRS
jgi:hypothetical protein